jgi:hypothetical protein
MLQQQGTMAEVHITLRLVAEAEVVYLPQHPELHTQVVQAALLVALQLPQGVVAQAVRQLVRQELLAQQDHL